MSNFNFYSQAPDLDKLKSEKDMLLQYANRIDSIISKFNVPDTKPIDVITQEQQCN